MIDNKLRFTGIKPQYIKKNRVIAPIAADLSSKTIENIVQHTKDKSNVLSQGCNGIAYNYGQALVVKKHKGADALLHDDLFQETKKLDILYEFCKENNLSFYPNQIGVAAFKDKDGALYMISTKVPGNRVNVQTNPLNKNNLKSIVHTLELLDKGSPKLGRIMVYDFNHGNINITPDSAGLFDFEHLKCINILDEIKETKNNKRKLNIHMSDSGLLTSNLRSFEFDYLSNYLIVLKQQKGKEASLKLFLDYLDIKSDYNKNMAEYFNNSFAKNNDALRIASSEKASSRLLKEKSRNIVDSELRKIQLSTFLFNSSRWSQITNGNVNKQQITDFYDNSVKFFRDNLQSAHAQQDQDRIIYYENCIKIFDNSKEIKGRLDTLEANNSPKLTSKIQPTILDILD